MATFSISTTLALSLLFTLASAQVNPGSYDISAEHGWDNFVKEAAKGTGGTPIYMKEFVTRDNNNLIGGVAEEVDRALMEELKTYNERKDSTSLKVKFNSLKPRKPEPNSESTVSMDNIIIARMIASANNEGSSAPEHSP